MKKEFIPYEQALALKELGFDEPCLMYFDKDKQLMYCPHWFNNSSLIENEINTSAPTWQSAFRWFREKYNIVGNVKNLNTHTTKHKFYAEIVEPITVSSYSIYDTYEEAELECLKKLIEIIKNGK
jgi:hypothetical protein